MSYWKRMAMLASGGLLACLAGTGHAGDDLCADEYQRRLQTDISLSYEAFDQTRGSGFRALASEGCWKEAADLIEAYVAATGATEFSLLWHIAQLRAAQGDYASAIRYARRSLRPEEETEGNALRWNEYVLAVIAFLERDLSALRRNRDAVTEGLEDHHGNGMNLKILDALIANFDETYEVAVSRTTN